MDKRFLAILAIIVLAFGGFLFFSKSSDNSGGSSNKTVQPSNHTFGTGTKVTLVEYGDFQCPSCAAYFPIVSELKEKYKNDMTFQFRHFPLTQIHPNAFSAHRAAEAAGRQGKFWEMHDKLYQNQLAWTNDTAFRTTLEGYAKDLGLDVEKFKTDYASSEVNDIINADISEGNKLQIDSTPSFLLNGEIIENPRGLEAFEKVITDAIAKANGQQQQ